MTDEQIDDLALALLGLQPNPRALLLVDIYQRTVRAIRAKVLAPSWRVRFDQHFGEWIKADDRPME